jgi:exopolyphosphatase/guanosine-5'-triphosphate,3'-diphosphate pyrophosphatase
VTQDSGLKTTLVALAGTATTLSSINQKMAKWDPDKIQGSRISMNELDRMISMFRRMTHDSLRTTPGMVPGREETLLAGSLILKAVMDKLGVNQVTVSDRGVRYGLFYQEFS